MPNSEQAKADPTVVPPDVDRVAVVSRRADGTADQTAGARRIVAATPDRPGPEPDVPVDDDVEGSES